MFTVATLIQLGAPPSVVVNVHFCRPATSSATYIVSRPDGVASRSNIANANGLPPVVGMPGSAVVAVPIAVGVPKPILNTFVNPLEPDDPNSCPPKMAMQRTLSGDATVRTSPETAPTVLAQTPPFAAGLPVPAIQTSVPSKVVALRALSPLLPTGKSVDVFTVPAISTSPTTRLPDVPLIDAVVSGAP